MKTIILTGLQGTGKSRIANQFEKEEKVQFIEIQERSGNNTTYRFGKILLVNLDLVEYETALKIVSDFIKKPIYCVGDVVYLRQPFSRSKVPNVCIRDCEGDLSDIIENFEIIK